VRSALQNAYWRAVTWPSRIDRLAARSYGLSIRRCAAVVIGAIGGSNIGEDG